MRVCLFVCLGCWVQGPIVSAGRLPPARHSAQDRVLRHPHARGQGPRGRAAQPERRSHGHTRLSAVHQDQHVLVGEDTQVELQAQEVPHQAASGQLRLLLQGHRRLLLGHARRQQGLLEEVHRAPLVLPLREHQAHAAAQEQAAHARLLLPLQRPHPEGAHRQGARHRPVRARPAPHRQRARRRSKTAANVRLVQRRRQRIDQIRQHRRTCAVAAAVRLLQPAAAAAGVAAARTAGWRLSSARERHAVAQSQPERQRRLHDTLVSAD